MRKKISEKDLITRISIKKPYIEYISGFNSMSEKVQFKCKKCNNIFIAIPKDILRNDRDFLCPHCESRKISFIKLSDFLIENSYTLIKKDGEKLTVKHSCGTIFNVRQSELISGEKKCQCLNSNKYDFNKKVYELVGDEYSIIGEYRGTNEKVKMKHNTCGKIYDYTPHYFVLGNRCPFCSKTGKRDNEQIKERIFSESLGEFILLSNEYKNEQSKITVKEVRSGEIRTMTAKSFFKRKYKPFSEGRITTDDFKKEVLKIAGENYEVIGDYKNGDTKIEFRHLNKHNFKMRPHNFRQGNRCPICSAKYKVSGGEKDLLEFIKKNYKGKIEENIILPFGQKLELDIYIPELKIGIEFNGLYWHSETCKEPLNLKHKTEYFNKNGIRVVHVFEDEWVTKREIVERKILNILGISNEKRIFARKCFIKEVTSKDRNIFLNQFHIQGEDKATISLGLYYDDELVSVMSFCPLRETLGNKKKKGFFELSRFATSKNVVGGFSKLLKYAVLNYNIKEILTYADLRWSSKEKNVYRKNGFTLDHISEPAYFYFTSVNKRYHRYNFRKQVLKKKFPRVYDASLSEKEIMRKAGYHRIYDCGNLVYKYTIK